MPPKQSREDPLALSGLDPERIDEAIQEKKVKPPKPPSEIEIAKEQRLLKKEERLAGGGASSSAAPPPADNYAARSKLLDKLGAYRERFPWLKSRNKTVKNMEEIEDELHYFELQLANANHKSSNMPGRLLVAGMAALETSTQFYNPLGLNLKGLGQVTKENLDEFEPILDELVIKYGGGAYMPPEYRLALSLGAVIFTVHTANSGDLHLAQAMARAHEAVKKPAGSEGL